LEAAARSFDLDFIPIHYERYDLVVPQQTWDQPAFQNLLSWLKSSDSRGVVASFPGYDSSETGRVLWIN
jgi:putative molybdopterin biosynthesis protein